MPSTDPEVVALAGSDEDAARCCRRAPAEWLLFLNKPVSSGFPAARGARGIRRRD
ncbi:MAG: hypothetical protein AVDCRST_MAG26-4469 [uncultured Chloroflexia bacterium]|uniref:Uncharacterized protein n=1 Tax=uncultured Chloroflexia bacterium TaxID=1672391 RepID=A0A6J4K628_9CHLR|nr:MAG: hypothetical protein AVDCRST_MAG26-4469 [uncultured Chloroflexia bacterium]